MDELVVGVLQHVFLLASKPLFVVWPICELPLCNQGSLLYNQVGELEVQLGSFGETCPLHI